MLLVAKITTKIIDYVFFVAWKARQKVYFCVYFFHKNIKTFQQMNF